MVWFGSSVLVILFITLNNIQVQVKTGDTWELYHGFNSLSDDYAYANAMEAASRAIAKVAKEKASTLFAEKVL